MKSKKIPNVAIIEISSFDRTVKVVFDDNWHKLFKDEDYSKEIALCETRPDENLDKSVTTLYLPEKVKPSIIAHECFHAVCHLSYHAGFKLSQDSDEVFAYLLEYLVASVCKAQADLLERKK